jgi:hypothetical protein
MALKIDRSFQTLTPAQTGLPFALKDLFDYVAAKKKGDIYVRHNAGPTDPCDSFDVMSSLNTSALASKGAKDCDTALKVLEYYKAARADTVTLDIGEDVVGQLVKIAPTLGLK